MGELGGNKNARELQELGVAIASGALFIVHLRVKQSPPARRLGGSGYRPGLTFGLSSDFVRGSSRE